MANPIATTDQAAPAPVPGVTRREQLAEFWYYFSENRGAVIGFWVFLVLVALALLAPRIAPRFSEK